jgi:membrane protease YdiL (CAAX protease family)
LSRIEVILPVILPLLSVVLALASASNAGASVDSLIASRGDSLHRPTIGFTPGSADQASEDPTFAEVTELDPEQSVADGAYTLHQVAGLSIFVLGVLMTIILFWGRLWRIPRGRGPDWPQRPELLLFSWIILLLSAAFSALLFQQYQNEDWSLLQSRAIGMVVVYLVQGVVILILLRKLFAARRKHPTPNALVPMPVVSAIGIGLLGFLVAFPIAQGSGMLLAWLQEQLTDVVPDAVAHETLKALQEHPNDRWSLLIMLLVVVAAPVVEEFSYRGLVQQGFRRLGGNRIGAVALTSVLFVLMHLPVVPAASLPSAVTTLLVLSIILGWIYERTGRLIAPIILHGLFNATNLLLAQFAT